jgi:hypothetical protein
MLIFLSHSQEYVSPAPDMIKVRTNGMRQQTLLAIFGGWDFLIWSSFLFASSMIIVWCLATAMLKPIEHLTCPLLSMF